MTDKQETDQERIVREVEAMTSVPPTPTQAELNQAMADLTQHRHKTIDDLAKKAPAEPEKQPELEKAPEKAVKPDDKQGTYKTRDQKSD